MKKRNNKTKRNKLNKTKSMKNQGILLLLTLLITGSIFAQVNVKGKVLDEEGIPLPGATVLEQGAKNGTVTDFEGNFTLTTKSDTGRIIISFIGYKSQELLFSTTVKEFNNVRLMPSSDLLDEVVIIGYGSEKKQDLSTAVSSINLDSKIKSRPSANLESILQGQLAGVTIQSGGGDPYSQNTITIRGRGSKDDVGVLYIVDGVPNAPFNVEDVEKISVLKDGASASVYGSHVGSNGVIVITTRKPKQGLRVNVNSSIGVSSAYKLPKVVTSEQFIKVMKDAFDKANRPQPSVLSHPYFKETRTNWFDEVFRNAFIHHQAFSVMGGNDKVRASASFSYDKQEGILKNTYKEIFGTVLKVDFDVADWLNVSERITYKNETGQGGISTDSHQGLIAQSLMFPRSATVYEVDSEGRKVDRFGAPIYHGTIPRKLSGKVSGFGEFRNPFATLARLRQYRPSNRIFSTTSASVKPIDGLTLKSEYTIGFDFNRFESFNPRVLEIGRTNYVNSRYISSSNTRNWLLENTINYKKSFGEHSIDLLAGYFAQERTFRGFSASTQVFSNENKHLTLLDEGKKYQKPSERIEQERSTSRIGRFAYSYDDRYFLTGSIRGDATSKLHPKKRLQWFKAGSAAWKISSEPFFEAYKDNINLLKLRASWGEIGNVKMVPTYSYISKLEQSSWYSYFGLDLKTAIKGKFQSTIPNIDLTWERSEQLDIGLDITLFNALEITVDYFDKATKDLIDKKNVPSVSGIKNDPPYVNIGKVSNKGWEVSAKYNNHIGALNYNVYGNFNTVDSKVISADIVDYEHNVTYTPFSSNLLTSSIGQPWYSYHLLKTDGIFQTQSEVDNYTFKDKDGNVKKIQPNAKPGDLKYVDTNNDGVINSKDKQYMGSYLPKITYSFGLGLDYKGIDFSMFFQGISGVKIFNVFKAYALNSRGQGGYFSTDVLNSWEYNKNSGLPRLGLAEDPNGNFTNASDFFLEDGSYIRLKNVTLGYTLPDYLMGRIGVKGSKLRLYLNAENLFTFTKYSGLDPEVGGNGTDAGRYPVSRTLSLGVNFNF